MLVHSSSPSDVTGSPGAWFSTPHAGIFIFNLIGLRGDDSGGVASVLGCIFTQLVKVDWLGIGCGSIGVGCQGVSAGIQSGMVFGFP